MLIVLEGDLSFMKLNDFVGLRSSGSEYERYLDFDERILFSLFFFDVSDRVKNNDESDNDIIKYFIFRKRNRESEISNFFSNILFSFCS
jgi:hypothetical protein